MIAKCNVMLVATYDELIEEALTVSRELTNKIHVRSADLTRPDKIKEIAEEARSSGVDVFISRGGTALELRKIVPDIPTAEIPVTGFDLLEAIYSIKDHQEKFAIVGFSNVIQGVSRIVKILGVMPEKIIYLESKSDCEAQLRNLKENNVNLIVGDNIATRIAKKMNFQTALVRSGKQGLITAFNEAERLVEVRDFERARSEQIRIIFDYVNNGIISTDHKGTVTAINSAALRILELSEASILGNPVAAFLPALNLDSVLITRETEIGTYNEHNDKNIIVNKVPIISKGEVVGLVATVQEFTKINSFRDIKEIEQKGHIAKYSFKDIIGQSKAIKSTINKADKYSKADSVILIYGETGTGKELFAQGVHNASYRNKGPFVAVNCAAIPESLLESELFGYVKGAFTDARREGKIGLFEQAEGGTLLLDEITELPINLQARLLRVLQEKEIVRVGDDRIRTVDVRIIATTNKKLDYLLSNKMIREDLYYRINVLPLEIPPLRYRKQDIRALAEHFLKQYAKLYNKMVWSISEEVFDYLASYQWPGNIRELQSVIERLVIEAQDSVITKQLLIPLNIKSAEAVKNREICDLGVATNIAIKNALIESGGNKKKAAKLLGIARSTLWRKLSKMKTEA